MHLIPEPKKIQYKDNYFILDYKTDIVVSPREDLLRFSSELKTHVFETLGISLDIKPLSKNKHIEFKIEHTDSMYEINVSEELVEVIASDSEGLFYGLQTLKQLIIIHKRHIPCLDISDSPDFLTRGYYHDVTRGKVPTLDQLKYLVDLMASFKLNQLQLYVEHTYLYSNQSEVWSVTDPLTAEEIMMLDQYCAEKYIELVPSIATFGHLYELLQSFSYKHLSELGELEGFSFVDRMRHHTLDVTADESLQVVKDMIDDFMPLVRSNKFNICADETFDLGEGKNKALAESIGKSKLYVDFLNKIVDYVQSKGKEVMFWGDIILEHPEHIDDLPKDLVCLNWWYWLNYPEEKVKIFQEHGFSQIMCPGVSGWNKLMNDHQMAYDNCKLMIEYGKTYNAIGVLNTDWGDYGHWNALSNSIPGMIYGAAFSWGESRDYSKLNESIDHVFYQTAGVMTVIDQVSRMHYFDVTAWVQWIEKQDMKFTDRINVDYESLENSLMLLDKCIYDLQNIMCKVPHHIRHHMMTYIVSAEAIKLMNQLLLVLRVKLYDEKHELSIEPKALAVDWEYWLLDFKKLWYKENKASELYRIVSFIERTNKWLRKL